MNPVDVIIPVYNTPIPDLKRCIGSIIAQSYSVWNLIIIDDGSQVEIAAYLDEIAMADKRICVYHIPNGGVSNARNYGIKLGKSPFFCFCDADDEYEPYFLEDAVSLLQEHQVDLVVGGMQLRNHNGNTKNYCAKGNNKIYRKDDIKLLLDYMISTTHSENNVSLNTIFLGRPCPKLYRRSTFQDIAFESKLIIHEDNIYSFDVLNSADSVCITSKIYYKYWQNDYSVTHSSITQRQIDNEMMFIACWLERLSQTKNAEEYYDATAVRFGLIIGTIVKQTQLLNYPIKKANQLLKTIFSYDGFLNIIHNANIKKYYHSVFLKGRSSISAILVCKILHIKNTAISSSMLLCSGLIYNCYRKLKYFKEKSMPLLKK